MSRFNDKPLTPEEMNRKGLKAKLLRENPIFMEVIDEVYKELVSAEDSVTADASVEPREAE